MKSRFCFLLTFALFLFAAFAIYLQSASDHKSAVSLNAAEQGPTKLTLSLTPTHDPDQLLKDSQPLLNYLKEQLGLPVEIKMVTDYQSIVQALASNHIDVSFMPGLPTVLAIQTANCRPLCVEVQRGRTFYYSHIYVRKESDIKSLEDLKGRSIAFTDPVSSSGFLYPLSLFYETGLIQQNQEMTGFFDRVYWAGGYESALVAMYNGHVDASCGSQHAPSWYLDEKQKEEIRLLAKAGPLPTHAIVARKGLGDKFLNQLQSVLLKLNEEPNKKILKDLYHADGLEPASKELYDPVLSKARATGLFAGILAANESS